MAYESPKNYDEMGLYDLEADPIAGPVLQEEAMNLLKESKRFTGKTLELDDNGYLIADGVNLNTKPSQNLNTPELKDRVVELTREALRTS